jgi:5,10-methylenetetrahydrofolate reductase
MKRVEGFGVPIMAGIIPLKSAGMARFMNKNVSGVFVPEATIDKMTAAEDKTQTGLDLAAELCRDLKDLCQGLHIMPIGWEMKVTQILDSAGL